MATSPTSPLVSVDEYLNTSYEYDMEFVDGVLVERAMPSYAHGLTQSAVIDRLRAHRKQFGFAVVPECRVELVARSRYRVPDVLVSGLPGPEGKVVTSVPLAVIEILSPDDGLSHQVLRFMDYWKRGVREIVVLDPEEFVAYRFVERALVLEDIEHLNLPDARAVPFSTADIFNEVREELSRQE